MKYWMVTVSIILLASTVIASRSDDLEPNRGLFSGVAPPEPYYLEVRHALIGEHWYRKCQLLALPAFEREWAVYMLREESEPPKIVAKRFRKQLWAEMMRVISDGGKKQSYSLGAEAQKAALAGLQIEVESARANISGTTADLLEEVWSEMLRRVRYPDEVVHGRDGVRYQVSHWANGVGFRSGATWSPRENSRPAALVQLAELMRDLTEAPSQLLKEREKAVSVQATTLLSRLKRTPAPGVREDEN